MEELLGTSQQSLRQLEKSAKSLKITKIQGRRYYKITDIEKIADVLGVKFDKNSLLRKIETKTPNFSEPNQNKTTTLNQSNELKEKSPKINIVISSHEEKHENDLNKQKKHNKLITQVQASRPNQKEAQLDMFSVIEKIKKTSTEQKNQIPTDIYSHKKLLLSRRSELLKLIG